MKVLYRILMMAFVGFVPHAARGLLASNLYPFGEDSDDARLPVEDDVNSPEIPVPLFTFYGSMQDALYVNENGFISFGRKANDATPARFPTSGKGQVVVPYWADVYTPSKPSGGDVWYRSTKEKSITSRATKDVIRAFPVYKGFVASWVFIATWSNVTYYGASEIYKHKRNTFQAVLTTDGSMSFVAYIYDNLSWTTGTLNGGSKDGFGGMAAQTGFSSGHVYYKLPGCGTKEVLKLAHTSNCGQPGVWFFRVDDVSMIDEERCDSKGVLSLFPTNGPLQSGSNIVIDGLCYRPTSEIRCDFGEAGVVKGHYFNDTKAFCTVPLITSERYVTLYVILSDATDLKLAKAIKLDLIRFSKVNVRRQNPKTWTMGSHVNITWSPHEMTDQPVMVEIVNFIEVEDEMKVHSIMTVVKEQPNTGHAEFSIPNADVFWNLTLSQKMVSFIRVRGKLSNTDNKYVPKQWIWSDLFLLTSQRLANKSCLRWHEIQSQAGSYKEDGKHAVPCPKTSRQMLADVGRFTVYELCNGHLTTSCKMYYATAQICYRTMHPSPDGLGYKCCYDNKGELISGLHSGGNILTALPSGNTTFFSHFLKDVKPYLDCCVFSDNCLKFHKLRPSDSESSYSPPRMGASFGDPHILTFDGVEYTFNGFGEYTVLKVDNMQFTLQGRMQPLKGEQSRKSPATVFTAFAMKQIGSSTIQVQRSDHNSIEILIEGIEKLVRPGDEIEFPGVIIRHTPLGNHSRVMFTFDSGITVYIENAAVLQMAISLPSVFKGSTRGLLGHWDDNSDKEFLLPNNEFLSTASTMSDIHHFFGQRWATRESESLFTYNLEEKHNDYFDESYVPTFMDGFDPINAKMNGSLLQRALRTCDQSEQCMFDIGVTGRFDIGRATREFQEWLQGITRDLHYEGCRTVVTLDHGRVTKVISNENTEYQFSCNQGYVMKGQDRISCTGGEWDGSRPTCRIACPSLDVLLANGSVHGGGSNPGDRYTFKCNMGFLLVGKEEIYCGEDGSWSGQVPVCRTRTCSQVSIGNAQVQLKNGNQWVISCNDGYILIGSRIINCLHGALNGTLPTCIKAQQRRAPQPTNVVPVIIIGVVVLVIAILVIVMTVFLVRKHHKRKTTRSSKEMHGDQTATDV